MSKRNVCPGFVLGVLVGGLVASMPAVAWAQFLTFQTDELGLSLDPVARGARLAAMGGLRFVVPDENNELNLADFGANLAGVAADKDGWSLESSFSRVRITEDFASTFRGAPVIQRNAVSGETSITRAIYRNGDGRAIGGTFRWNGQSVHLRYGDRSRTRGPEVSAFWNEAFGDLALALGMSRWSDEQSLKSPDVFAVHHASTVLDWTLAAAYPAFGLEWGAQASYDRVRIEGKSLDPSGFHQDDFEWLRPTQKLRLSALLPEGGDLELGANVSFFQLDGAEDAEISWSDRFPGNPGGFDFQRDVPVFEEEESGARIEARALHWLGWAPRVGAFVARETRTSDVVEAANFVGSRRAGSLDRTRTEFGGGFGTSLLGERLTVGVEGLGIFQSDETTDREGIRAEVTSRDVSGRVGVEWFSRPDFALRGGYERLIFDEDTDAPFTLQTGQAATAGFGWVPKGALYVVDGMVRFVDRTPDETGGAERDGFELALYGRLLF